MPARDDETHSWKKTVCLGERQRDRGYEGHDSSAFSSSSFFLQGSIMVLIDLYPIFPPQPVTSRLNDLPDYVRRLNIGMKGLNEISSAVPKYVSMYACVFQENFGADTSDQLFILWNNDTNIRDRKNNPSYLAN